jgi:hypothetical protein
MITINKQNEELPEEATRQKRPREEFEKVSSYIN